MAKGLFAAGHVGLYLFLQRLHWTFKKSCYEPSAEHINEKWPWTSKVPCARAQLWGKAWWPGASSEVSLGTGGQVTRESHIDFASALTCPGLQRAGLCLQWHMPAVQAVAGQMWHWRHLVPACAKAPLPHLGLHCNPAPAWGNGTSGDTVTWLPGDSQAFHLSHRNVISVSWDRQWRNVHISFSLMSAFPRLLSLLEGSYSDAMKAVWWTNKQELLWSHSWN